MTSPAAAIEPRTLADLLPPRRGSSSLTRDALLILAGSLLIAAGAQVSIPLPFTPVPVTGQTFSVLLVGAALGWRRGFLAVLLYLAEGAMGLPVFAGGAAGPGTFLRPSGGYLIGFPLGAALTGLLAGRGWDRRPLGAAAAMFLGSLVILGLGCAWLSFHVGGLGRAFMLGVLPFLPGDMVKVALAAGLLPGAWKLLGRKT
jgi:biotin transport system substrate-specific component